MRQVWAPELSPATPGCPWACSKPNAHCISIDVTGVGLEHLGRCDRHHLLHRGALAVGFAWIFAISTWTSLVKPKKRRPWNSVTRCSSSTSLSCFILWPRKTVVLSTNQGLDNYFSSDISPDSFSNGAICQRCNKRPIKHLWYVYLLGECISNAAHTRHRICSIRHWQADNEVMWASPTCFALPESERAQSDAAPPLEFQMFPDVQSLQWKTIPFLKNVEFNSSHFGDVSLLLAGEVPPWTNISAKSAAAGKEKGKWWKSR